jgi:DNA polymerase-3 subunit beta
MRASFERSELLRLLGPVTKVVESKNIIPILSNLLLSVSTADGGTVTVKGTDLDIEITTTGAATVATAGAVTVDAKRLEDIVRKLPAAATIAVELLDGAQLTVKSGRSRFRLPTLPVADYPDIAAEMAGATTFDADIAALFKPVAFAISTEETRHYLNGIYLHVIANSDDGERLRAVATDGHRLAQHDQPLEPAAAGMPGVIVPRKTVGLVPPGVVTVSVSETKIRFTADGLTVTSKVVDGTFPDYRRVIPNANDKMATVEREALFSAADRVSSVTGERGRAVKFAFTSGAVALSVRGETGDATDELAIEYELEPMEIGFNAGYLRDILGVFPDEQVQIRFGESNGPALITSGGPLLCVLMPMRV